MILFAILIACGIAGLVHFLIYLIGEVPLIPVPFSIFLIVLGIIGSVLAIINAP